jgi:hypothetical protein
MAMNIPDFWIKTIKEKKDEELASQCDLVGNDQPPCR